MTRPRAWLLLASALFPVLVLLTGCASTTPEPLPTGTALPDKAVLERQKLAAEVRSIQAETTAATDGWNTFIRLAPLLTVLVAAGTLTVTYTKDRRATRDARAKELAAAATEARKRHEEAVAGVVQTLGSESARQRLGAAAALAPVLRDPTDPRISGDLIPVLVANLRIETDADVADALIRDLGIALRQLPSDAVADQPLDLTRAMLRRLRVPGVPLPGADVAFAILTRADLTGCNLRRLRGFGADLSDARLSRSNLHEARLNRSVCRNTQLHHARMVSATFRDADLRGAQFQQADLQGARFAGAICQGAVFTGANLAEAWFLDPGGGWPATLDASALRTAVQARNGRSAHWTRQDRHVPEQLSAGLPTAGPAAAGPSAPPATAPGPPSLADPHAVAPP